MAERTQAPRRPPPGGNSVDLAHERLIADGLRAEFPTDGLIAEEGSSSTGTSGRRWIVDPLDGTRNYVTGAGLWSVCIALQNGEPLRASGYSRLAEAIVGLSFDAGLLLHTKLWDIAAGLLVAAETGVILSGPDGTPTPELTLAASPALWREFSEAAAAVPRATAGRRRGPG